MKLDEIEKKETGSSNSPPSLESATPEEQGGTHARRGFNYQDHVAVRCLLDMFESTNLVRLECETQDDMVCVFSADETTVAEFIQVKAGEPDKLWSPLDICRRKGGAPGTSILEKSLACDKVQEKATFRIVTLRPTNKALEPLTFERGHSARDPSCEELKNLTAQLNNKLPGVESANGNGVEYWLRHTHWVVSESLDAIRRELILEIVNRSVAENIIILPDQAETLLDELLLMAKNAADAKPTPNLEAKWITRQSFVEWWENRMKSEADSRLSPAGKNLKRKLDGVMPDDGAIELARDLQIGYLKEARSSKFMGDGEKEAIQAEVRQKLLSLRTRFWNGELSLTPNEFHALCLSEIEAILASETASVPGKSAFATGCMYDITDRCQMRFESPTK